MTSQVHLPPFLPPHPLPISFRVAFSFWQALSPWKSPATGGLHIPPGCSLRGRKTLPLPASSPDNSDQPCLGPLTYLGPIAVPRSYISCLTTLQNHAHWRWVRTSGVPLSVSQPALGKGDEKPCFESFADFYGVVMPPILSHQCNITEGGVGKQCTVACERALSPWRCRSRNNVESIDNCKGE